MEITTEKGNEVITLAISGKISAATSESFDSHMNKALAESNHLILDFDKVDYLASAGLRVLVSAQKKLKTAGGSMILRNLKPDVRNVFEMTGFDSIFSIE
jgi:anti-anti-sigma factor